MSIVRVGLSEQQQFADGYDAIFNKKKGGTAKAVSAKKAPAKAKAKSVTKKKPR